MEWHESGLTVGQVAERMNVAPSAIRWWADQGLLPHERTATNRRRFLPDVCCRVAMIRASQRVGLTLDQIAEALDQLPAGKVPASRDWDRLASHLRAVAGRRVDELLAVIAELSPPDAGASGTSR